MEYYACAKCIYKLTAINRFLFIGNGRVNRLNPLIDYCNNDIVLFAGNDAHCTEQDLIN